MPAPRDGADRYLGRPEHDLAISAGLEHFATHPALDLLTVGGAHTVDDFQRIGVHGHFHLHPIDIVCFDIDATPDIGDKERWAMGRERKKPRGERLDRESACLVVESVAAHRYSLRSKG